MLTCGFCGTEVNENNCSFCEMELEKRYILKDGKRFAQKDKFLGFPSESEVSKSTKELMEKETIDLVCLLRDARRLRTDVYKLRKIRHDAEKELGFTEQVQDLEEQTYDEYEYATRKVWVIENIIKNRLGYYPQRINDNYINGFVDRIEDSEKKEMRINN